MSGNASFRVDVVGNASRKSLVRGFLFLECHLGWDYSHLITAPCDSFGEKELLRKQLAKRSSMTRRILGDQPTSGADALDPLLTVVELAKILGTSERHVRRLVAERRLPFIKVGHFIRFSRRDISEWLTSVTIIGWDKKYGC